MIKAIKSGNTNCYLLNTGKMNILIDAGTSAHVSGYTKKSVQHGAHKMDVQV